MAAPQVTFTVTEDDVSQVISSSVTFTADSAYQAFEARATKEGEPYGVGIGTLIAAFSYTPANTARTFEIYDEMFTAGDGLYRLSLFAQGQDGSWNDDALWMAAGEVQLYDGDGNRLCVQRNEVI